MENQVGKSRKSEKTHDFSLVENPREIFEKQNPESGEQSNNLTLNFALVFKSDLPIFEAIRKFLLKSGSRLIYQSWSTEKLIIRVQAFNRTVDGEDARARARELEEHVSAHE